MTSDDPVQTAGDMGRAARAKAYDVVDDVEDATRDLAARAHERGVQAQGAMGQLYGRVHNGTPLGGVGRGVVHQPVEALLLAGAIGYLAGWLLNR